MPCYDHPPAYEQEARKNAQSAVQILCGLIGPRVRTGDNTLSFELLTWFIEHRRIDIEIERDESSRCVRRHPRQEVVSEAERDIALAKRQLARLARFDTEN
jgi:hypothetical protein